ncbi:MAG: TIR domain-containing protein [Kiloniellales bacterium]|nr:TIR domain-containing protein [Kiloniellales bacterium]
MPSKPRIFVSYARSDGGDFASALSARLRDDCGFSLWRDLADMEGGRDWWPQIVEAITGVEYLVLVMTPNALKSEVVRREWRLARQEGVCVVPVIGSPELDFSVLPHWMQRTHFVDTGNPEQWTRFVRTLESPCTVPRVPVMAEAPPEDFVEREAPLGALTEALLDAEREAPVAITAALRGAGGYGKTTLAQALCQREDIQDAFHDGILWVTLGEQPGELTGRVQDLIHALSGERPGFATQEAASAHLAALLEDRQVLIVVDDVWNGADLGPFMKGGKGCARLITTRDNATLPKEAHRIAVDAMESTEAVELLCHGLPKDGIEGFDGLAERLGEWPLLLRLVNGVLHERIVAAGEPIPDALRYANQALDRRGITAFDAKDAAQRNEAVSATLAISLETLSEDESSRFAELAVFPEDVEIPLATLETLWAETGGLDDFETEELCLRLFQRSLLLSLDLTARRIGLHDVVLDYLRSTANDLPARHRRLLAGYRARCPDGWPSGPDDGYFYRYLPYHLGQAGEQEALRALLTDYGWIERQLQAVGINAVLAGHGAAREEPDLTTLARTLRLSAPALARDESQLAAQLLGRLAPEPGTALDGLTGTARQSAPSPAMLPLRPSLTMAGAEIRRFDGHEGYVLAVAITADGKQALSASSDRSLRLWDLDSGAEIRRFSSDWSILCCDLISDPPRVVFGDTMGRIHLLELRL